MIRFHPLVVAAKQQETPDSVRLALDVPSDLRDEYRFLAGQHLPIQIERNGRKIRRTYSICSEPGVWPLELGVRVQPGGQFSEYAAGELKTGDVLDAMRPNGQFHAEPDAAAARNYLAFAAGSGITPVLSIMSVLLHREPQSRFTLFYGNRTQATTMFIDDLFALKNRYPERLQLHFLFSREQQEFEIASGRLDAGKVQELYALFCRGWTPDVVYICGPDTMIDTVTDTLVDLGVAAGRIHSERFGAPRKAGRAVPAIAKNRLTGGAVSNVTVIMDGHRKSFDMTRDAANIVDAAAEHGIELPFSCKGGVCATCRTHVQKGDVTMATNYGLEPWEVEKGFVLACQSVPNSDAVVLDYDKT